MPDILDAGGIYVSPNAGPSNFAGKECHKNYFVVSWQNDNLHEATGQLANNLGYKKVFVLAPNYQAGKDAIAGFKRLFKGEIAGEVYTRLDQTDFAPEMAQIRAAKPDAVYPIPSRRSRHRLRTSVSAGRPARHDPDGDPVALDRRRHPEGDR